MNYKQEIKKMLSRIPNKVVSGSYNMALGYKAVAEKARTIAEKSRPTEAELLRAYADLQTYE